jgi:hypothetical protein
MLFVPCPFVFHLCMLSPSICFWAIEQVDGNNTCFLLCHTSLSFISAWSCNRTKKVIRREHMERQRARSSKPPEWNSNQMRVRNSMSAAKEMWEGSQKWARRELDREDSSKELQSDSQRSAVKGSSEGSKKWAYYHNTTLVGRFPACRSLTNSKPLTGYSRKNKRMGWSDHWGACADIAIRRYRTHVRVHIEYHVTCLLPWRNTLP